MYNNECDLLIKCIGIVENDVHEKGFNIVLILRRLTLGIGNLMSSHSLSAGHVPLGLGRDIGYLLVCLEAFACD